MTNGSIISEQLSVSSIIYLVVIFVSGFYATSTAAEKPMLTIRLCFTCHNYYISYYQNYDEYKSLLHYQAYMKQS